MESKSKSVMFIYVGVMVIKWTSVLFSQATQICEYILITTTEGTSNIIVDNFNIKLLIKTFGKKQS